MSEAVSRGFNASLLQSHKVLLIFQLCKVALLKVDK